MKGGKLIFIVGPTASGKTGLAIKEATAAGGIILSCDSLCFYKGMDIGTAKPTPQEQAQVPHYGIDLAEPDEPFSIARYVTYRDNVLNVARAKGQTIYVVGGSGFYLKSFFSPVMDELRIPAEITKQAEAIRRNSGLEGLVEALRDHNPEGEAFEGLDLMNPRRVEKALIRCLTSKKSYSQLRAEFIAVPAPLEDWEKEVWLVNRSMEALQERNRLRVEQMLQAGLVEEVRALRERGFERNPSACGAIGYREVIDYLDGNITGELLPEMIFIHTNQLMRKQRTWFRHQIPVDKMLEG